MSKNFILEKNNFLSKEECDILIKDLKDKVKPAEEKEQGYDFFDLEGTPIFNQIQQRLLRLPLVLILRMVKWLYKNQK